MKRTLAEINAAYECILHSADRDKDEQLAALLTVMERQYKISALHYDEWEKNNRVVGALYRKISRSRTFE